MLPSAEGRLRVKPKLDGACKDSFRGLAWTSILVATSILVVVLPDEASAKEGEARARPREVEQDVPANEDVRGWDGGVQRGEEVDLILWGS